MPPPKGDNDGLLSRVVRFVRHTASGWSETDFADADPESGYSRQMLKEMIERKRRNDFVRKREFDMLRKLRRNGAVGHHDPGARPSFFQSSMPSRPDDRASTLKKIDEIEAQMSQQWWKTKGSDSTRGAGIDTGAHVPARALLPDLELPTQPSDDGLTDLAAFEALASATTLPATLPTPVPPGGPRAATSDDPTSLLPSSGFAMSRSQAVVVEELAHDPELEEAAIRYANGDIAGAEVALRALLAPGSARAGHEDTWLALFDLYRATGQSARYEEYALGFANRFGRSPPQWRPLDAPAAARAGGAPATPARAPVAEGPRFLWTSPPVLEAGSVAALRAALARAAAEGPWRLDWAPLVRILPEAVAPLLQLFMQWCSLPVHFHFHGAQALQQVLADAAPAGDRAVDTAWWKLRMEALRLMHRPDEFELAALDYCVTYEVSPPSWDIPRCHYRAVQAEAQEGGSTLTASTHEGGWAESQGPSTLTAASTRPGASGAPAELAGTVLGDASALLEHIDHRLVDMDSLVISCARLVRMDFAAAGTLLNWATARHAEGRAIHLVDVNRLVAEFFHVIGISAQARISLRRD